MARLGTHAFGHKLLVAVDGFRVRAFFVRHQGRRLSISNVTFAVTILPRTVGNDAPYSQFEGPIFRPASQEEVSLVTTPQPEDLAQRHCAQTDRLRDAPTSDA